MTEVQKEQEIQTKTPRVLPTIQRMQEQTHSSLFVLSRASANIRTLAEQTRIGEQSAVARAADAMVIAQNVSALRLDNRLGPAFMGMLENI